MKLWIASSNRHKIEEIHQMFGPTIQVRSLNDIPDFGQVEETGETFHENAAIKARALYDQVKEPVFADDSGLEVDALGGRPGVYSMRYSAPNPTHEKNIDKLLGELKTVPLERRTARFRCTICFIDALEKEHYFDGTVEGLIGFDRRGEGGFGFDPVFFLPEFKKMMAELSPDEKNLISHRGRAIQKLKEYLRIL